MQWLHTVADKFKGDVAPISKDDLDKDRMATPDQAAQGVQEILNNPAYFDAAHPLNKSLRAKMLEYQKALAQEV